MKKLIKKYRIPVVSTINYSGHVKDFSEHIKNLQGLEGFVIRFNTGHMVKFKSSEYVLLHKTLEGMAFEKDVVKMIIDNKTDDIKAILPVDQAAQLDDYAEEMMKNVYQIIDLIYTVGEASFNLSETKKDYALMVKDMISSSLYFKLYDILLNDPKNAKEKLTEHVFSYISNSCGSQSKIDSIRWLIGERKWEYV